MRVDIRVPHQSSAQEMKLLDQMTQEPIFTMTRLVLSLLMVHVAFLASFKHISILEGESKSIFCSWVNLPGQVLGPPAENNQLRITCLERVYSYGQSTHVLTLVGCTCHQERSRAMFLKVCDLVHACIYTLYPKKYFIKVLCEIPLVFSVLF